MQEFQQPAFLMTEVVAVMSMMVRALWSKFTDLASECCELICRVGNGHYAGISHQTEFFIPLT